MVARSYDAVRSSDMGKEPGRQASSSRVVSVSVSPEAATTLRETAERLGERANHRLPVSALVEALAKVLREGGPGARRLERLALEVGDRRGGDRSAVVAAKKRQKR